MYDNRIRTIRKILKISQKSLAKELGVSHWVVCDWECGRSEPSLDMSIKLSKIFNTSLDYIYGCNHTKTSKEVSPYPKYLPETRIEFALLSKIQNMDEHQLKNLEQLLSLLSNFNRGEENDSK